MTGILLNRETREFVDFDLSFDKHPDTNNLLLKKRANSIKQSVLNLLQLNKFDVPFHPEIYSPITHFLFEAATPVSKIILESECIKYLGKYEPRLDVLSVDVSFPTVNTISCSVVGIIVNTSEQISINLVIDRLR